ncbi:MAG: hypothetical protein FWF86_03395 [Clostridia bacterium]|nr:hypothetical protein [Clostridia bacterium]
MDVIGLLNNKAMKAVEKRNEIEEAIKTGALTIQGVQALEGAVDDKRISLVFEAMEAVTEKNPEIADLGWLKFAQKYITSQSNNLKRESSRIVGNIAHLFPNDLEAATQKLLANTSNDGTVIRWSSAYALGRIISVPQHANSELLGVVTALYEQETDTGIRNQYLRGLKQARKIRRQSVDEP